MEFLGPPILMLLGGLVTWIIKSRVEELRAIEHKLREERRKIYVLILEPYIKLFADAKGRGQQDALNRITSFEYRKTAFELGLFGSDEVVRAYNALMIHAYQRADSPDQYEPKTLWTLFGRLLLEIRKSLGNKRNEVSGDQRDEITRLYGDFKKGEFVRIFDNTDFCYRRITVERPLKLNFAVTEDRLAQVLDNLLDNAIRHAPQGSAVSANLEAGEREIRCAVHNPGPGIPDSTCPSCSNASTGRIPPGTARRGAAGWGWRSCGRW